MKNSAVIVITVVILVVVGFGVYLSVMMQKDTGSAMKNEVSLTEKPDGMMGNKITDTSGKDTSMTDKGGQGKYVEYSPSALGQASSGRRVLYFFANWCPTCRPADASFRENEGKIPEDVTVIRVNYSDTETDQEEKDLAAKYAVTYQHTYVQIDGQGKEVTTWNGGQMKELLENIQ